MRRLAISFISIILIILIAGLCQTALNPEDFSGIWYSANDQTVYRFQEGLIYSAKHAVQLSDSASISGAYTFCKESIFMFVTGIDGLETEREVYLVENGNGSFLCENDDGTGIVYFIRYNE